MQLAEHLRTSDGWDLIETALSPELVVPMGSNFLVGNGYLGYRGTLAEWRAERYVACTVSDTYDLADGTWRELCNAPNGLYARLSLDGQPLCGLGESLRAQRRVLDLKRAVLTREAAWHPPAGPCLRLRAERLAHLSRYHLLSLRYEFWLDRPGAVTLETGLDGRVWDLHGPHFARCEPRALGDGLLAYEAATVERGLPLAVVEAMRVAGAEPASSEVVEADGRLVRCLRFVLDAGQRVCVHKVAAVYSGRDADAPLAAAADEAREALARGWEALRGEHEAAWRAVWDRIDVGIEGDLKAQAAVRFCLYHHTIATPAHSDRLPIGARGLSCQAYQGAAFWDQEIFNLPAHLFTRPELARNLLVYRHRTLDGARRKARRLGYEGAYYAWISGESGDELCPDHFFRDVATGRPLRTHFNDWQIHISPDVAYAVWQYYRATGDWDFVLDHGAEIVFEVACFLRAHVVFSPARRRYEFRRVIGPDEYHENVDNNAFTNHQARFALAWAVALHGCLAERAPARLEALRASLALGDDDIADWDDIARRLHLPGPADDTGLIAQFEGFFALEDVAPEALKARLLDPQEYWGCPIGVAVPTQVSKQADVIQLFSLHPDRFAPEVMRANYDYYEPRTQHGSSLSHSAYAIVAAWLDRPEEAYRHFMASCLVDLDNSKPAQVGGTFIGGVHTAACAAAWWVAARGLLGLRLETDALGLWPRLPPGWRALRLTLRYRGQGLRVAVTPEAVGLQHAEGGEAVPLRVYGRALRLEAGAEVELPRRPSSPAADARPAPPRGL